MLTYDFLPADDICIGSGLARVSYVNRLAKSYMASENLAANITKNNSFFQFNPLKETDPCHFPYGLFCVS